MAPACTRSRIKWTRKQQEIMARPCASTSTSTSTTRDMNNVEKNNDENDCSSGCSTPKAKRFRIPEVLTCPPAPKKRRVTPNCSSNKTPIAFFASLDIELFFFSALRNNVSA